MVVALPLDYSTFGVPMVDPKIAILIPAYNEELVIEGTIKALLDADAERKDIYVVDDRSTDRTTDIARSLGVHVHTVPENCGKALAQTAALEHFGLLTKYDWVIFLDGDTKVDPYFVNAMFTAAKTDPSVALYVGQVKSVKNTHVYSAVRAFDYTFGHDVAKQGQSNFNVVYVSPGCASMYKSDVLKDLHIDHMTLAEDMDLTVQVHRKGGRVQYISDATVHTQDPANLKDYIKQSMRWSRGFWQVMLKHRCFFPKQRVDWYMLFLAADGIIFNKLFWMIIAGFVKPTALPWIFLADVLLTFLISLWCSYRTKRSDVIYKMPIYYWLGYLQLIIWIWSLIEIIILRKEILAWNKVARYDFNNHLET